MPMHCLLLYYTGTFNTRYITRQLQSRLTEEGWTVDTYEIDPSRLERLDFSAYDIVGLGSPIYGFCAPYAFLRFIRHQKFPKGLKTFIYKNSGETQSVNDASHKYVRRKLRRDGVSLQGEYHFLMPYNIHFRFPDALVREMLEMNRRLMEVMVRELQQGITHLPTYSLWSRFMSTLISRPQYIAGDLNSFFYRVKKDRCTLCQRCIKQCPTRNIYIDSKQCIAFHHDCLMCMRCSFYCPKDAIRIGFLDSWGWRVNGGYDWRSIEQMPLGEPFITPHTKGFFACYVNTYARINRRYAELVGPVPALPDQSAFEERPVSFLQQVRQTLPLFARIKKDHKI